MSDYLTGYKSRSSSVKDELSLSNYATKEDLKYITHVDTSSFALKTNLPSFKTEVDKLDIPKLTKLKPFNFIIVYKSSLRTIVKDGILQVNGLFGNLKIGNTNNTLRYRNYDGIEVFLTQLEVMVRVV